ncbi:MAG: SIS domain-containing protein [Candidatus Omnitrophica bacterium]|nr:SIS domain-containing protein [Candidatus Omnitrophota bacterium]
MKDIIERYHNDFAGLINSIEVGHKKQKNIDFYQGVEAACKMVKRQSSRGGKIFFIGNGGSAAIASHMAIDFWKNGFMHSMSFNDGALLTCLSNDFGYENVFSKPIKFFARKEDLLFAISSSGKSKNILNAVKAMRSRGSKVITLSGFRRNNPLRRMGICNFYVPSCEYGLVEVTHQYICHIILDVIMRKKK